MNESPVITKLLAKTRQEYIVAALARRFGKVPPDVVKHLGEIVNEKKLKKLHDYAVDCPSVEAFRDQLFS